MERQTSQCLPGGNKKVIRLNEKNNFIIVSYKVFTLTTENHNRNANFVLLLIVLIHPFKNIASTQIIVTDWIISSCYNAGKEI